MTTFVQNGFRWEVAIDDFQTVLATLLAEEGRVVKRSPVKLVTVHRHAGRTYYVKRYQNERHFWRMVKYRFRDNQARREWRLAMALAARGVPIVRHLALGERRGIVGLAEAVLVTEGFDGQPVAGHPCLAPERVRAFVDAMHDRGVAHDDLHPANILASPEGMELRLVDLDGISVAGSVSPARRAADLAFLKGSYRELPTSDAITTASVEEWKRRVAYRSRRCLKRNREFGPEWIGGRRWQVRFPLLTESVGKILADPDGFLDGWGESLKRGRSCTVGRGDGLVLKRYNRRTWWRLGKDLFRAARVRRNFQRAYHLELAGIATATPVACGGNRWRGYVLMREIAGATPLHRWLGNTRPAAELLARLHEAGFTHRDLKPDNILFNAVGVPHLIDWDGLRWTGRVPDRRAVADLARVARGARDVGWFRQARFLRAYCAARGRPDWRSWWSAIRRRVKA